MEIIFQAAKDAGAAGAVPIALIFIALWGMEVKERWRREAEDTQLRVRAVKAQIRLARILTKLFMAMGQADDDLDADDDGADD